MAESKLAHSTEARSTKIVIFGKSGTGKSALGNMILGRREFKSTNAPTSVTDKVQMESVNFDNDVWFVVDTPGFWDPGDVKLKGELEKCFVFLSPGFHVALYTISLTERFTPEDVKVLDLFIRWFGEDVYKHLQIVFTKVDQFYGELDTYMSGCDERLKAVIKKCKRKPFALCSRGYDKGTKYREELKDVIDKIKLQNSNGHYTSEDFMKIEALLQNIDIIMLPKIREREDKKFRTELDRILLEEFPNLSIDCKFDPDKIKVKQQERRNEETLKHEHDLHNLVREESIKLYEEYKQQRMAGGLVVGGVAGYAVAGPSGVVAGSAVGAVTAAVVELFRKLTSRTSEILNRRNN